MIAVVGGSFAARAEKPTYRISYDPATERLATVGEIPDEAWGDRVDGLQAAISAPAEVRYFERFEMFVKLQPKRVLGAA